MKISRQHNVKPYNQDQMDLFPPSVKSLIDEDHLCNIINDVVDMLDLSALFKKLPREGNPSYHPAMMVKILFYAYAKGLFSSRKIAAALKEDLGFIFLAAWQKPDFRTISDFRKNNLKELSALFNQIVELCEQMGMVKLGHIAIDGTKVKANASDAKTYDRKRIDREIGRLLASADAADRLEDQLYGTDESGDEVPADVRDRQKRLEKLQELKQQLDDNGKEKINRTDTDAVFMKTGGGIITAYNAQAAVDAEHQVIIAADVSNDASDAQQLLPMIEQAQDNVSQPITECSADAGYSSGENLKALEEKNIDAYIPDREYQAQQRGKEVNDFHKDNFVYDEDRDCYVCVQGQDLPFSYLQKRKDKEPLRIYRGRCCTECPFFGHCTTNKNGRTISRHPYEKELGDMRRKLDSPAGKAIYDQRKYVVEPPFGHIKAIMGFTSFMLRGLEKVKTEFKLVSIAHNLRKICQFLKETGRTIGEMCPVPVK